MTSTELLMEGVELMLMGMGTVFVFLVMLVGCIGLMSRLVTRFIPEPTTVAAAPRRISAAPAHPVDRHMLAAISEAVRQHRARRSS